MDVAEVVPPRAVLKQVLEHDTRMFGTATDHVAAEHPHGRGDMRAQHIDVTQRRELVAHLVLGHLARDTESGRTAACEAHRQTLDLDHLRINEPAAGREMGGETTWAIDVSERDVGVSTTQCPTHLGVGGLDQCVHPLAYLILSACSRRLPGGTCAESISSAPHVGEPHNEVAPNHFGEHSFVGAMVDDVEEISEHEQGLTGGSDSGEIFEGAVDVGDEDHPGSVPSRAAVASAPPLLIGVAPCDPA